MLEFFMYYFFRAAESFTMLFLIWTLVELVFMVLVPVRFMHPKLAYQVLYHIEHANAATGALVSALMLAIYLSTYWTNQFVLGYTALMALFTSAIALLVKLSSIMDSRKSALWRRAHPKLTGFVRSLWDVVGRPQKPHRP